MSANAFRLSYFLSCSNHFYSDAFCMYGRQAKIVSDAMHLHTTLKECVYVCVYCMYTQASQFNFAKLIKEICLLIANSTSFR